LTLELYADRNDYGIRTVGLPDIAALGVCFGQVITAMSPANGDINWGMILWHELGHVFAIQLSNSRVPRWFTEGLSEYETLIARPDWRRENDADLYGALANGTLPSIGSLNSEFLQPDANAVVVAYYQSAVTIEYLIQTYGFPKIVEALKLYGKGSETADVLQAITGKPVAQLDAEFRKYLEIRLKAYAGTFKLPTRGFDDVTKLEIAADAAPKDAKARAQVALGHYYGGDAEKAMSAAAAALALDAKQPFARYIQAEVVLHQGDLPRAKALYQGLIVDGFDNFDLRSRLAQIAEGESKSDEVELQLCAAKKLDPERSFPYQQLAQLYEKTRQMPKALAELEQYAFNRADGSRAAQEAGDRVRQARQLGQGPHLRRDGDLHQPVGLRHPVGARPRLHRAAQARPARCSPTTPCCWSIRRRAGPRWSTSAGPRR